MADTDPVVVEGSAGQPVELPIAHGPATGYSWSLDLPAGVTQTDDGPAQPVNPGAHLGASSGRALRVIAAKSGRYRITAKLARPWEPDNPQRVVFVDLVVK